ACLTGKWNQLRRLFIVQVDSHYQVFSLNMFQRFNATFLKIFQLNYFKMVLGGKQLKVLGPKDLNLTAKKVSQHAPQPVSIPAPPTVPPSTQPANLRPAAGPQRASAIPSLPGVSPENMRNFEYFCAGYAFDHSGDEVKAFMRSLYVSPQHANIRQELEIYLNWKIPAAPQPLPAAITSPPAAQPANVAQAPQTHPAPIPAPPAVPQPVAARHVIPGLSPEEIEEFETSYDVHAASNAAGISGQDIRQQMQLTFQIFPPEKRAKLEIYLNWKLPQPAPQLAAPQPSAPAAAVAAPHLDELPSDARPSRFVVARNGLSQFNRDGDRFKSSCALMAAAYLAANKQATPQSIEEAINSPRNPANEHLEVGDDQVAKYRQQGNRLEPIPAEATIPINEHTLQDAEWAQFLQNRFDQLFNQTQGCLLVKNSKTYCIRRVSNSSAIEFFDSHGYSQLTGKEGGFVAEFRDLKHLKAFLNKFKPFIPIPGGQVGYALLFAKSVKA
ncbi:MAG: hypothetical protein LLG04_09930, partial [Parachlamydia sp.]|nr:hypothetical protein [Parachlamydia sp.]